MSFKGIFFSICATVLVGMAQAAQAALPLGKFGNGIAEPGTAVFGPPVTLISTITALMKWLLSLVGFIAIIAFVYAGITYMTSAGDEGQAEQAKKIAKYALLGLIVALGSMVVLQAMSVLLKGESRF